MNDRMKLLNRISIDPNICFGKPCIRGTRIWVSLLLDFLADGMSVQEVIEEYPHLKTEDVRAALAYGAEMSSGRYPFAAESQFDAFGKSRADTVAGSVY
jgi:uncharacterized protein (DUF433 family)